MEIKDTVRQWGRRLRVGSALPLTAAVRTYGDTDKLVHDYTRHYDRHLHTRRWRRNRVLEIGVGGYESREPGGSLRVWRDYFPRSRVVGVYLHAKEVDLGPRVAFVQGDQTDPAALDRAVAALGGPPDVVIDDGSHLDDHAGRTFRYLFPQMSAGAVYVVEDVHTSYWETWGGGLPAPDASAVGLAKALVDAVQVNDSTYRRRPQHGPAPTSDVAGAAALHVYPGIVFVEKVASA